MKTLSESQTNFVSIAGGAAVNLLFIVYIWLVQPVVLRRLDASLVDGSPDYLLGGILLAVQALEFIGLLLKRPLMAYWVSHFPRRGAGNWKVFLFVLTPILHLSAAAMLLIPTLQLLGLGFGEDTPDGLAALVVPAFFIMLTKEAFFVTMMLPYGSVPPTTPVNRLAKLEQMLVGQPAEGITRAGLLRSWLGDILLLCFSAPVYTTIWVFMTENLSFSKPHLVPSYIGFSIYFLMVTAATRGVYIMFESAVELRKAQRVANTVIFLLVWASALLNIPTV